MACPSRRLSRCSLKGRLIKIILEHCGLISQLTPDLQVDIRDGFASLDIENLKVHSHLDAALVLDQILADELAGHVWTRWEFSVSILSPKWVKQVLVDLILTKWALGDLGAQNTRAVGVKEGLFRRVKCIVLGGVVRLVQNRVNIAGFVHIVSWFSLLWLGVGRHV